MGAASQSWPCWGGETKALAGTPWMLAVELMMDTETVEEEGGTLRSGVGAILMLSCDLFVMVGGEVPCCLGFKRARGKFSCYVISELPQSLSDRRVREGLRGQPVKMRRRCGDYHGGGVDHQSPGELRPGYAPPNSKLALV